MTNAATLSDYQRIARRRLPKFVYDYVEGGAGDESAVRANLAAFDRLALRSRRFVDVSSRSLSTTVVGQHVDFPVLLAPTGLQRLVRRRADLEAAKAAAAAGTVFVASSASAYSIEEICAQVDPRSVWFQLYLWRDRAVVEQVVKRAHVVGCPALVVTVDVPLVGIRARDLRNGMQIPPKISMRNVLEGARHPGWSAHLLYGPPITFKNFEGVIANAKGMSLMQYSNAELTNPGSDWNDLDWIRQLWPGKLIVKGLMTGDDARRAAECGADAVIVSNHGGRQLEGMQATMDVLPEIVEAVGDTAEVMVDGGIRRGVDVLRALALGARAVFIGRPYWWGLAAAGQDGVSSVLQILRRELDIALGLTGCTDVRAATPDLIAH